MTAQTHERCPGCGAYLPQRDGPTHRYIGASPACWALFTALNHAGQPPLAPAAGNLLLPDAYAAQHPGTPSPQAIRSVALHLLALYGVLVRDVAPDNVMWVRRRVLRYKGQDPFRWLAPPSFAGSLTVADVVAVPTPAGRTATVREYVAGVWERWSEAHGDAVAAWYERFVVDGPVPD